MCTATGSVADSQHINADTDPFFRVDADPDPTRIWILLLMRICNFWSIPSTDLLWASASPLWASTALHKSSLCFHSSWIWTLMRIWLFTKLRIPWNLRGHTRKQRNWCPVKKKTESRKTSKTSKTEMKYIRLTKRTLKNLTKPLLVGWSYPDRLNGSG